MVPRTTSIDQAIGARVRQRRRALGMNQTELGEKIGVTYQQLQKYEVGTNRMGAGRLAAIASALDVPITFFFDQPKAGAQPPSGEDAVVLALRDPETVELVRAFAAIPGPTLKRRVVEFVQALPGGGEERLAAAPPVTGTRRGRPVGIKTTRRR